MLSAAEYRQQDGLGLAQLVKEKAVTPLELVETAVSLIETVNPQLNAVVTDTFDIARASAQAGLPDGPFAGVPFLIKDLGEMVAGVRMTGGSRSLANFIAPLDTDLVRRFRAAGLNIVGKTNTPEFGLLPTTESELLGACANPWDLSRSAGGSSGGAAAAVAAGLVPVAHASDGGGSIRIPAACCGLFGLKPTRARTPQGPIRGDSLGGLSIGFALSRTVRDSAALLDAVAGPAPGDPYWAPPPQRPFLDEVGADPGQLRIALMTESLTGSAVDERVKTAVLDTARLCESLGHIVEEATPAINIEQFIQAFTVVWAAGCSWSIKGIEFITGQSATPELYEPLTWQLHQMSLQQSPGDYLLAIQGIQQMSRQVATFFERYDLLLTPVVAEPPPLLGSFDATPDNPLAGFMRATDYVPFTPLANATGQPAISVPLHWTADNLPIGSHFIGRFGDEATLFRLAAQLEQERPWRNRWPDLITS